MHLISNSGWLAKRTFLYWLCALLLFSTGTARAENYKLSLTRKGSNVYKVDGRDIIIQTRYCYVYAYSEEAVFKSAAYGGEVHFLQSKDKCDVKTVFGANEPKPGKYTVTVSRDDDDWYQVFGTDSYIKTWTCLSLALGEEAFLTVAAGGFGRLRFRDGTECMVEGIYSKIRL